LPAQAPDRGDGLFDLGLLPQPAAGLAAAAALQPSQQRRVIARAGPQIPGDHAGGMPGGVVVHAAIPQVDMPAEAIDRLATDATEAGTARKARLAIRRRREAEARRPFVGPLGLGVPAPPGRRAASRREAPRPLT